MGKLNYIHFTINPRSGQLEYIPPRKRTQREAERSFAEAAMYAIMGDASDPTSLGIPMAKPSTLVGPPPAKLTRNACGGRQPLASIDMTNPGEPVRFPLREASSIVSQYLPSGYHKWFCAHDRYRGLTCSACKRGASEAKKFVLSV